ncbi:hypothetical protein ACFYYR_25985 [Streptomyces sp. NPDC001922]|uniref:hypothetical protein n=1 Tax=Streptomyces sp. NPDC001922 TaxID=3364624 RepID=UPI003679925D
MKIRTLAAAGMTGAALLATLTVGTATADTVATPTKTVTTRAGGDPADCGYQKGTAKESVRIRSKASLDSKAYGLLPKGKTGGTCDSSGATKKGQTYNLCGKKSNVWVELAYAGNRGWVPTACLKGWYA